jgi:hypothetical protein
VESLWDGMLAMCEVDRNPASPVCNLQLSHVDVDSDLAGLFVISMVCVLES